MSSAPDAGGATEATQNQPEVPPEPEIVEQLRLAAESAATRQDWERATAAVLRKTRALREEDPDSAVWNKLARTTLDGIAVAPIGTPSDLEDLATSGRPTRQGAWDVRVATAGDNERALAELAAGATSLWLHAEGVDVEAALQGVYVDLAPVVLHGADLDQAKTLAGLAPLHPDTNLGATQDDDLVPYAELAAAAGVRAVIVDGTAVHEQGASDGQELGWLLARGAQVVRTLADAGISDPFDLVEFRVAVTDEQFPTIAKLRALRRTWARVAELSGVEDAHTRVHAVTSRPMASTYDVHTNMLRGTVAAFAAGVGGADAVTVLPFDEPVGGDSELGRRVARNTSALLIEESHVAAVTDPAGGAYAVEKLTDELAKVAWAELGRVEQDGLDAFDARVADVRERRDQEVATRRRPITGLTEFPNAADAKPEAATDTYRYGAAFEALRDHPAAAAVFLATMGPIAAHTARATFITNLLAAGGIAVEPAGPTEDVASVLAAYESDRGGQPVVCLAGTDTAYAEWGGELATALKDAGATHVIIAGKPIDGVDDSAAMGVDALAFLARTRKALT